MSLQEAFSDVGVIDVDVDDNENVCRKIRYCNSIRLFPLYQSFPVLIALTRFRM